MTRVIWQKVDFLIRICFEKKLYYDRDPPQEWELYAPMSAKKQWESWGLDVGTNAVDIAGLEPLSPCPGEPLGNNRDQHSFSLQWTAEKVKD